MNGVTSIVPAATQAKLGALAEVLDIPDVTGMEALNGVDPESLVELVASLEHQLDVAQDAFDRVCGPALSVIAQARGLIKGEIIDRGGKALPHDRFDVRIEQTMRPDKRIDILRSLEGILPDDLYRESVFIKSIDVSQAEVGAVNAVVAAGGKPTWDANLTKLNKHARDFGGDIARIVEQGSPRVAIGEPKLVIVPRESALKSVS